MIEKYDKVWYNYHEFCRNKNLIWKSKKMNRTKRKIFNVAMKLFSEKGYDATSVEEITAITGIAKRYIILSF